MFVLSKSAECPQYSTDKSSIYHVEQSEMVVPDHGAIQTHTKRVLFALLAVLTVVIFAIFDHISTREHSEANSTGPPHQ